jgi:Ca2+-binding RTX toxin-like protein
MALPTLPGSFVFLASSLGTNGDDNVEISRETPTFSGLNGNDYITLQDGDSLYQYINGNMGDDAIVDGNGLSNDTLFGGQGDDTIVGVSGDNIINGNLGSDSVTGGANNDYINGGRASDTVSGSQGNDTLSGDLGDDLLSGGSGSDLFVFSGIINPDTAITTETDIILDFSTDGGDKIALAGVSLSEITITNYTGAFAIAEITYEKNNIQHVIMVSNATQSVQLSPSDFVLL